MKSYLIKQLIVSGLFAIGLFIFLNARNDSVSQALWWSVAFLNILFVFFFALLSRAIKLKSQVHFSTFFGVSFGIKFFASLLWVLYFSYVEEIRENIFILGFFALYFLLTFTVMIQIWYLTKRT